MVFNDQILHLDIHIIYDIEVCVFKCTNITSWKFSRIKLLYVHLKCSEDLLMTKKTGNLVSTLKQRWREGYRCGI